VAPDVSRSIVGQFTYTPYGAHLAVSDENLTGPFKRVPFSDNIFGFQLVSSGTSNANSAFKFDSGLAVPVGPEASPRTMSVRYWRRVT